MTPLALNYEKKRFEMSLVCRLDKQQLMLLCRGGIHYKNLLYLLNKRAGADAI